MRTPFAPPQTCALGALVVGCIFLTACASGPQGPETGPTMATESRAPGAGTEAKDKASVAPGNPLVEMRKQLAAAGIEATDTPEGQIKINIPADVSFGQGSAAVRPTFSKVLNSIADILGRHPAATLEIIGHTDSTGSDALNTALSRRRAESARNHLVTKKIAAERIKVQGWGSDQAIGDNKTAQGRALNRRVEIYISER